MALQVTSFFLFQCQSHRSFLFYTQTSQMHLKLASLTSRGHKGGIFTQIRIYIWKNRTWSLVTSLKGCQLISFPMPITEIVHYSQPNHLKCTNNWFFIIQGPQRGVFFTQNRKNLTGRLLTSLKGASLVPFQCQSNWSFLIHTPTTSNALITGFLTLRVTKGVVLPIS